jgi:hypothetical protein
VARLLDPWSTPHQISDDLESFFWVLLYQIVRGRDQEKDFRQTMAGVFDQYESVEGNRSRGGKGKLSVLKGGELPIENINSLTFGTPCHAIIEDLRALFNDSYRFINYIKGREPKVLENSAKRRKEDPRVQEAHKKLQSSDEFLDILGRHLNSTWEVNNDASVDPSDPLLGHSASRNRRKRPATDSGKALNFHQWHRGRMPPKSIERSGTGLNSQSSSGHGADGLFSVESRMETSSCRLTSDSPRPSDEGSTTKQ